MIFFQTFGILFKDDFIKNQQTTIALPFLTHNISTIGGVTKLDKLSLKVYFFVMSAPNCRPIYFYALR